MGGGDAAEVGDDRGPGGAVVNHVGHGSQASWGQGHRGDGQSLQADGDAADGAARFPRWIPYARRVPRVAVQRAPRACGRGRSCARVSACSCVKEMSVSSRTSSPALLAPARRRAQREPQRRSGCAPRPRPPRGSCRRCRWTGRTGALNGCSSTARRLQERRERSCFLQRRGVLHSAPCPARKNPSRTAASEEGRR